MSNSVPVRVSVRKFRNGNPAVPMCFLPECGADIPNAQQAYLFKFYGDNAETPIFSKIGTTTKSAEHRLRQEIGEYCKKGFMIVRVDICAIIQCGERPAEGHESYLRSLLMNEYPNTWRKNDRFFDVDVSTEHFMAICEEYFSRCENR